MNWRDSGVEIHTPLPLFSDPRVRAFLALSPQGSDRFGWEADSWDVLTRPYMTITGSCDDSQGEQAVDRLDPFRYAPAGDQYLAYVTGAYHKTIGGNGCGQPDFPRPDLAPFIRMAAIVFLDASLKDCFAAKEWLRTPGLASASAGKETMQWKLLDSQETAIPVTACSASN